MCVVRFHKNETQFFSLTMTGGLTHEEINTNTKKQQQHRSHRWYTQTMLPPACLPDLPASVKSDWLM